MRNPTLAADHVRRASARLLALDTLYDARSWADVVRESQEVVELALKGLLHAGGVDPPRIHDVSDVLEAHGDRFPALTDEDLSRMAAASRSLRRDRELAFYGEADVNPSVFYRKSDADRAREAARLVVRLVRPHVPDDTESQRPHPAPGMTSGRVRALRRESGVPKRGPGAGPP